VQHAIYPVPPVSVGDPPPGWTDVWWQREDGVGLHGWHGGESDADGPVVLFFHGNGENLETLKWSGLYERWAELGAYAVVLDYPGYGKSGGSPGEDGLAEGARLAFDWAREHFPGRRLVIVGWSLGAAVATRLAAERTEAVDGLIAMSAWSRLRDVAGKHFPALLVRMLLRESWDSVAAAENVSCPSLVIHGSDDRIIPVELGGLLAKALGPDAGWVVLEGAGHNDLLGRAEVWFEVERFLAGSGGASWASASPTG
jgi:pimeloyl-ACP methyl ester carboxylesterase